MINPWNLSVHDVSNDDPEALMDYFVRMQESVIHENTRMSMSGSIQEWEMVRKKLLVMRSSQKFIIARDHSRWEILKFSILFKDLKNYSKQLWYSKSCMIRRVVLNYPRVHRGSQRNVAKRQHRPSSTFNNTPHRSPVTHIRPYIATQHISVTNCYQPISCPRWWWES